MQTLNQCSCLGRSCLVCMSRATPSLIKRQRRYLVYRSVFRTHAPVAWSDGKGNGCLTHLDFLHCNVSYSTIHIRSETACSMRAPSQPAQMKLWHTCSITNPSHRGEMVPSAALPSIYAAGPASERGAQQRLGSHVRGGPSPEPPRQLAYGASSNQVPRRS